MKHLFLSMAAVAMLASCSSDEIIDKAPAQKSAIGFSTFVDKSTRATDVTTENLKSFEVNGWRTKGSSDPVQNFVCQEVTANNGVCTYEPVQYWIDDYTYNFEAFAPGTKKNKGVTVNPKQSGSTISFTSDGETDLIYANPKTNFVGAEQTTAGAVNFKFNHLLSRVMFTFKNGFPPNAAAKLTIKDVKIKDAYKSGEITPAGSTGWSVNGKYDIEFPILSEDKLDPDKSITTEHKYLIPSSGGDKYTVSFTVVLNQGDGIDDEYKMSGDINEKMDMANSYNFTAEITDKNIGSGGGTGEGGDENVGVQKITFSANVTPWPIDGKDGYNKENVNIPEP